MKKKILSLCLVVAMVATAVVGASMAYLTDTEEAVNVMTVGKVDVSLIEMQRNDDGSKLEPFVQGKELTPLVGSAQNAEKDQWGQPKLENYVDKIVYAHNDGNKPAYIRFLVAVPVALIPNTVESANNPLHWNWGNRVDITGEGKYNEGAYADSDWAKQFTDVDVKENGAIAEVNIDGEEYWVTVFTMQKALAAGADSLAVMSGLYLDNRVDYNDETGKYTFDGTAINYDLSKGVNIPVLLQAVQTDGWDSADAAFQGAFGAITVANAEAWFADVKAPTLVATTEELDAAIADGADTVILGDGNYIIPDSAKGKTLTIVGNGNTVIAVQDDGSYEGCDYSLQGSTVTFENVTISTDSSTYTGYARLNATYNNCTINGTYTLYGDSVFNNCTFNVSGDAYNIWTWGAPNAEFNNCTFNTSGKSVLAYGNTNTTVTVNNCTFNDANDYEDVNNKAAIEVGSDWASDTKTIIVNNVTVNGFDVTNKGTNTGSPIWGNKNSLSPERLNVIVDGKDVY